MVEEWTTCMRLLSWRRHQGTMLKNCVLILPVSDPAKQAAQVVKHHVFDNFKAIYQFPKHIIVLVKIVANAPLNKIPCLLYEQLFIYTTIWYYLVLF